MEISCIILAGGKSKRLGKDKAFIKINGKCMINYVIDEVEKIFDDIVVVVKNEKQKKKISNKSIKIVCDNQEINSPIIGIKEGIKHIKNNYFFVVACDMPFIKSETIEKLISNLEDYECIVPKRGYKKYEPLFAIYKKSVFRNCDANQSMHKIIDNCKNSKLISIEKLSKDKKIFYNINSEEDLRFNF